MLLCPHFINMNLAELSDEQLKGFIIKIFGEYDKNNNGLLDAPEIALFFTDLYRSLGYHVTISLPAAQEVIREISQTGGISLTPHEIYCAFKIMSSNTNAYFNHFSPISPLSSVPSSAAMDVEDCPEWAWPQQ
jgi:Ca2+-binding EF-hand superfamily protein